jgi:hypothetical protein
MTAIFWIVLLGGGLLFGVVSLIFMLVEKDQALIEAVEKNAGLRAWANRLERDLAQARSERGGNGEEARRIVLARVRRLLNAELQKNVELFASSDDRHYWRGVCYGLRVSISEIKREINPDEWLEVSKDPRGKPAVGILDFPRDDSSGGE